MEVGDYHIIRRPMTMSVLCSKSKPAGEVGELTDRSVGTNLPWKQRARLAQSVEHQTFNLRVEGSSPSLGDSSFERVECLGEALIHGQVCTLHDVQVY